MYYEYRQNYGLAFLYEKETERIMLGIQPAVAYHHWNTLYTEPHSQRLADNILWGANAKLTYKGKKVVSSVMAGYWQNCAIKNKLELNGNSENSALTEDLVETDFKFFSTTNRYLLAGISVHVPIFKNYKLFATASWRHGFHVDGVYSNNLLTFVGIEF